MAAVSNLLLDMRRDACGPYLVLTTSDALEDWRCALSNLGMRSSPRLLVNEGSRAERLDKLAAFNAAGHDQWVTVVLCTYSIALRDLPRLRGFRWVFADDGYDSLRRGWAQGSPSQKLWQQLVADSALSSAFLLTE